MDIKVSLALALVAAAWYEKPRFGHFLTMTASEKGNPMKRIKSTLSVGLK
jgi:hypothetical protein